MIDTTDGWQIFRAQICPPSPILASPPRCPPGPGALAARTPPLLHPFLLRDPEGEAPLVVDVSNHLLPTVVRRFRNHQFIPFCEKKHQEWQCSLRCENASHLFISKTVHIQLCNLCNSHFYTWCVDTANNHLNQDICKQVYTKVKYCLLSTVSLWFVYKHKMAQF